MVGWHHQLYRHELVLVGELVLGLGDGQGGLACYSHGVVKSQTQLREWTDWFTNDFQILIFPKFKVYISNCVFNTLAGTSNSHFSLNKSKTELLVPKLPMISLAKCVVPTVLPTSVDEYFLLLESQSPNLGVSLDSSLSFTSYTEYVRKSCGPTNNYIRKPVTAPFFSHQSVLNHQNFCGISTSDFFLASILSHPQSVFNTEAKWLQVKSCHSSTYSLQWMLISLRMKVKILMIIVYKALY